MENRTDWYKDAVFYELYVRAFSDSNNDGIGDLPGITSRLDYLQSLGVDAIWLLPITLSPLRDDGYDVSDYTAIHPMYGSLDDFRSLVEDAHRRSLKIVVELVPNHTSDQHRWFRASRDPNHPEHARYRDYYVWSNTGQSVLLQQCTPLTPDMPEKTSFNSLVTRSRVSEMKAEPK